MALNSFATTGLFLTLSALAGLLLLVEGGVYEEGEWLDPITEEEMEAHKDDPIPPFNASSHTGLDDAGQATKHFVSASVGLRWPNGVVPFALNRNIANARNLIAQAMGHIRAAAPCIRFVPFNGQANFVEFTSAEPKGCFARPLGVIPIVRKSEINLGFDAGCQTFHVVVHEILHVLGAIHEQNRPDRDSHVVINWRNIDPSRHRQFWKTTWEGQRTGTLCESTRGPPFDNCVSGVQIVRDADLPYDLDSVMHYSQFLFSLREFVLPSIEARNGRTNFGNLNGMSRLDRAKLNRAYCANGGGGGNGNACCSVINVSIARNSLLGGQGYAGLWRGLYRHAGTFTVDGGVSYPVYRKIGQNNVWLAHEDSPSSFRYPWFFWFDERPGTPANSALRAGNPSVRCPGEQAETVVFHDNAGNGGWFLAGNTATITCGFSREDSVIADRAVNVTWPQALTDEEEAGTQMNIMLDAADPCVDLMSPRDYNPGEKVVWKFKGECPDFEINFYDGFDVEDGGDKCKSSHVSVTMGGKKEGKLSKKSARRFCNAATPENPVRLSNSHKTVNELVFLAEGEGSGFAAKLCTICG